MIRRDFDIDQPVLAGPLTFPEGPVLNAPEGAAFAYAGRRAYITGSATDAAVQAGVLPGFELQLSSPAPVIETIQLRSNLRRALERGVVEHSIVPLDLPALLWQWDLPQSGDRVLIEIELRVSTDCEWNHGAHALEIRCGNGQQCALLFSEAVDWRFAEATEADRLRLRVRVNPGNGSFVRLAALAGSDAAELQEVSRRLQKPQALLSARRTATLQQDTRQPRIATPDPALTGLLNWSAHIARNTILDAAHGPIAHPGHDAAVTALSLLALGDYATPRAVLQHLGSSTRHAEQWPLYLLLAARYAAWTADFEFMYSQWPQIVHIADAAIADGLNRDAFVGLVLKELADAAASLSDDAAHARFSAASRAATPTAEGAVAPLIALAFANRSTTRDPDFQQIACEAPTLAFASFVYGLLGVQPDAPKNRIRMRPALPAEWDSLELTNIPLADARIDLRYEQTANTHIFRLAQTAGAIPVRAVFEPLLPTARIEGIQLDGRPAELDIVRSPGGLTTPVQLDLDYERVLEIVTE